MKLLSSRTFAPSTPLCGMPSRAMPTLPRSRTLGRAPLRVRAEDAKKPPSSLAPASPKSSIGQMIQFYLK
jgi:hypothetical protein